MTQWRPAPLIKVKALGLHWRDGKVLAAEITLDDGTVKGVRPLGGHVEFGETWRETLRREFQEELGIDVTIGAQVAVMENIYRHYDATGHEVAFLAEVHFPKEAFQDVDVVHFQEDNGVTCIARWYGPEDLDQQGIALYPEGLRALIFPNNPEQHAASHSEPHPEPQ